MRAFFAQLAAAVLATAFTSLAVADGPARFGYGAAEDHPQGLAAKRFAETVKAKSGGRIQIATYASGKLGSDPAMQADVQADKLEFMVGPTSNLVGQVKEFAIFDLPYLVTNTKEADALLDGPVGQQLMAKLDAVGLVGLAYWENGFRSMTTSKHPITKLEDFADLKVRVIQNPVFIETFKALGATPVPMAFTELYGALQSKAVDAQENPVGLITASKFYEVQKYLSLTSHVYSPFIVITSKKWFDKLSDADKAMVREAAVEAGKYQRQLQREQNVKLMQVLKSKGMEINELPPAEIARLRNQVKPVINKVARDIGPQIVSEALAVKS